MVMSASSANVTRNKQSLLISAHALLVFILYAAIFAQIKPSDRSTNDRQKMSDSERDDVDEDNTTRRRNLEFLMGGLVDNDMDNVLDDADLDVVDELINGIVVDQADEDDDVDVDVGDGGPVDGEQLCQKTRQPYIERAIRRQEMLQQVRQSFGFPRNIWLEEVDMSEDVPEHGWLIERRWANQRGETGRVHEAIRRATDRSQSVRPELGRGKEFEPPSRLEDIRLPLWANIAPKLRASNTVSTVHTNCLPKQERFATNFNSTNFNPNSFAANKIKIQSTGLFFERGSGVVAGAKGEMASRIACAEFVVMLQRMDSLPFGLSSTLQNIVCNASCFQIDLEQLAQRYRLNTRYEVTRFPGLIFRPSLERPWVFIIFPRKIIGTGFVSWIEANLVWRWLFAYVLCEFKDKKDTLQESAAEKKNRTFNSNARFETALRATIAVSCRVAIERMTVRDNRTRAMVDYKQAWHAVLRSLSKKNDYR